ncbi:MAG: tetratricopeptide repeat protein [Bacteroidales bacterium]|nr:tetratricopeptide repeat protein [Bacteroidales bacterium]MBN2749175.1 tetratricopeptide repeat protein [Bacteroidales bacterium]
MKKLTLLLSVMLGVNLAFAQTGTQINYAQFEKKLAKSNEEIENPKKSASEKTWISRAELLMDVYDANIMNARAGMTLSEFNLIVGAPKSKEQVEVDGVVLEKFIMERVNFYFNEGTIQRWEVTNPIVEKPLSIALESLKKAIELDVKGKKTKDISNDLVRLKNQHITEGSNVYDSKDYKGAYAYFKSAVEIAEMPQVGKLDTAVVYYSALAAQLGGLYNEAIEMYNKCLDLGYTSDGTVYYNIYEAYGSKGEKEGAVKFLEEGFVKYPSNQNLLFALIQDYMDRGEDPAKILEYLKKAIDQQPDNAVLYFAEGTLYDRLGNFDEAFASYKKASEVQPDYFDAYFNMGALYFNRGVKYIEDANKVPAREVEKYDNLMAQASAEFKACIPFMEKALEVKPDDTNTLETLKNIYFRFRNESPEMKAKYDAIMEKINQ